MTYRKKTKIKEYLGNAGMAILPFIGFLLFTLVPMVLSLIMMFYKMPSSSFEDATFVGFDNFAQIFTIYGKKFGYTLLNTLIYSLRLPIALVLSIWISQLLNKAKHFKNGLRAIFFVTYVCSVSVIIIAFRMLLDEGSGVFNQILSGFGFANFHWLTANPVVFHISAMLIGIWSSIGYNVIMLQAAMSNVDQSYYEAARIDGASEFVCFWKITLPAITPILSFIITTGLIVNFQAYAETYILSQGAAAIPYWENSDRTGSWVTSAMWIYDMMFTSPSEYGFGMASATGWLLAVIIFAVCCINIKLQKKWVCYDF